MHLLISLLFLIKLIGVTVVNKIMQISGTQVRNTSSVHCILYPLSQTESLSITTYSPNTTAPTPGNNCTVVHVHEVFFFFPQSLPAPNSLLSICEFVTILLISSLDSPYEWVKSYGTYLSLTVLFHLELCYPGPSILVQKGKIFFIFYSWVVFHCVNIPQLFFFFLIQSYWWTLRLLPDLGYHK